MRVSSSFLFALFVAVRCFALPVSFEKRDATHFMARLPNGTAELRPDRITMGDVTLRFKSSASSAKLEGSGPAAPSTYLRAGITRTFAQFPRLAIHGLYPGVDAIFYGSGESLEYDLQLTAGASLDRVRISVEGARDISIDSKGNLTIQTASGLLQQMRPHVFQRGLEISARYVLRNANEVGLKIGKYDRRAPLTVDPVLAYMNTFGGAGSNSASLVATDAQGNIYVAGQSNSVDFPTTSNSFQPASAAPLRVLSNAGQSISPVRVGTASSVGIVASTPDGKIVYAATSQGILLSADSGGTWRQTSPLPAGGVGNLNRIVTVNAISIDPLDPSTVLVATSAGLFGTDSGGQFWGQRTTGLNVSASGLVSAAWVSYHPSNPLIAYAVTSGPSSLFTSSDAGNTWRRLDPAYAGEPTPPMFSFSPNLAAALSPDGSVLYAINGNGTLFKSTDSGVSWVKLTPGFFGPLSLQFDPGNPATMYVLDQRGLHKSADAGVTFDNVTTPFNVPTFAVDSSGAVYLGGVNQRIYVSTDGTKTFTPVPTLTGVSGVTLSASASRVYMGSFTSSVPFITKLDPTGSTILFSTFLAGSFGDFITGLTVDSQGNAVVVGSMFSPDFPLTVQTSSPPAPGKADGFLTKLRADGRRLVYSIALGASKSVGIQAVALDSSDAVFITGQSAGDLPTTANAFQAVVPSTPCPRPSMPITGPIITLGNAFVSKIAADGESPIYTTFLTGSCGSVTQFITVDPAGDAVVSGFTTSPDFPVSPNSYQSTYPGPTNQTSPPAVLNVGFVAKISPAGDKLLAGTLLGGGYFTQATSVVLDASGNAYVTGATQGIAPGATSGAFQTQFVDQCTPAISIGPGSAYTGTGDAFVIKLDPALSTARFLTYLGGGCNDSGSHIALDQGGNIWVSGVTTSPNFPLKDPFQTSGILSSQTGFISELNGDGSQLLFSSLSEGAALATGPGAVYLAGASNSSAFVSKIDPTQSPALSIDSINPVVAFPPAVLPPFYAGVAPGQLIQINGRNLGPTTKVNAQLDAAGRLPFILSNTVVFFDNIPAPLISVSASSIQCYVPFEAVSTAKVTVRSDGRLSNAVKTGIAGTSPQVLAIWNQDGSINSPDHPAKVGSVIAVFVSGLGQTNPAGADGLVNAAPLPVPLAPVTVYFLGAASAVTPQFVGAAPGMIAGITQVNVQTPASIPSGGANPVSLNLNGAGAKLYMVQ